MKGWGSGMCLSRFDKLFDSGEILDLSVSLSGYILVGLPWHLTHIL